MPVELTAPTAVDLVRALAQVLTDVPGDLTGIDAHRARRLLEAAQNLITTQPD